MCIRQTMERPGEGGTFGKASCNIEHVIYPSAPVSQSRSVPVVAGRSVVPGRVVYVMMCQS